MSSTSSFSSSTAGSRSPFFKPSTPHQVVQVQTPGGTKHKVHQSKPVEEHKSGLLGCTANLINAIIGSGIVGIPYAIQQAGFVAGIGLVVLCAILTDKSLRLLIATAKHAQVPSYETLAEAAFGKVGFLFITINMFIMAYGAMLSYLMIVKDTFAVAWGVDPENLPVKRALLFVISLLVMVPLSSQRVSLLCFGLMRTLSRPVCRIITSY
jgi:amino acid permease